MAASTLRFKTAEGYGVGLLAKCYVRDTDTPATNGVSSASTEGTAQKGTYSVTFTDMPSGIYDLRITTLTDVTVASGLLNHTDQAGIEYPTTAHALETDTADSDDPTALTSDATYAERLTAARNNYALILANISANPKPTYNVNGQMFSWNEYQSFLLKAIKELETLLLHSDDPVEVFEYLYSPEN